MEMSQLRNMLVLSAPSIIHDAGQSNMSLADLRKRYPSVHEHLPSLLTIAVESANDPRAYLEQVNYFATKLGEVLDSASATTAETAAEAVGQNLFTRFVPKDLRDQNA